MVKDAIMSWFLRNVILPRMEIIDNPGFIIQQVSGKGKGTFLREVIFPEGLLADIERGIVSKYGDEGKQVLYSAGKKFGYSFSNRSNFTKLSESTKKEFESFCYNLVRYIETTYATRIKYKLDLENKTFRTWMNDYIVCSKNGLGYVMTSGGIAGIWANIMGDKHIEGIQIKCQGGGSNSCEMIAAPKEYLEKLTNNLLCEDNIEDRKLTQEYLQLNQIAKAQYAKSSLKDLMESSFLEYSHGVANLRGRRHFLLETECIYILEDELKKLGAEGLLFKIAKDYGVKLVNDIEKNNTSFITDYMSALGWGDVHVGMKEGNYRVISSHYPWTEYSKSSDFIIFKGLVSGFLSGITGKDIELKTANESIASGFLDIIVS